VEIPVPLKVNMAHKLTAAVISLARLYFTVFADGTREKYPKKLPSNKHGSFLARAEEKNGKLNEMPWQR
jgi:hypothetical protein